LASKSIVLGSAFNQGTIRSDKIGFLFFSLQITNKNRALPAAYKLLLLWILVTAIDIPMNSGGQNLRALRDRLGLTMRDVETASSRIAEKHRNDEFSIAPSRLSDIETKGIVPSIFRLYSLAIIYRRDFREILNWYDVDLNAVSDDLDSSMPPKSHFSHVLATVSVVKIPVRIDPGFDPRRTANFGRMVEQWGLVPLSYLEQFASRQFTYGYIGSEDLTMYPLLPPGTFVQVDETKTKVAESGWRTEYERPIYFVETRAGHTCCWCTLTREEIILQPHPLSPVAARILKFPQEADIVGQVVGVAMRLGDWRSVYDSSPGPKAPATLN
jgi:transcriptional regulator with XRE-family HTH domain